MLDVSKKYYICKNLIKTTVKLGYNEQLGTELFCSLKPGFVFTGLIV